MEIKGGDGRWGTSRMMESGTLGGVVMGTFGMMDSIKESEFWIRGNIKEGE